MPRRSLSDELKQVISQLPGKEKDKLLFRLIPKDEVLTEQLTFRLLENGATTEERRQEVFRIIDDAIVSVTGGRFSPAYVRITLRSISGKITRHVKVTRDKYGEVELNLHMLLTVIDQYREALVDIPVHRKIKLYGYIIQRFTKIQKLLDKMHDDYRLDFEDDLKALDLAISDLPDIEDGFWQ